jgi:hypothetical protein
MKSFTIGCARCTTPNHPSERYCRCCGLPLGSAEADADISLDPLGPYEAPDPADNHVNAVVLDLVRRSEQPASPSGHGWRLVVPARSDRKQAVYVGYSGINSDDSPLITLVSVSGPANERDARTLLKWNARVYNGHFAVRVLRGEEYFVFLHNLEAALVPHVQIPSLVQHIARTADQLEDRLSRGRDLY